MPSRRATVHAATPCGAGYELTGVSALDCFCSASCSCFCSAGFSITKPQLRQIPYMEAWVRKQLTSSRLNAWVLMILQSGQCGLGGLGSRFLLRVSSDGVASRAPVSVNIMPPVNILSPSFRTHSRGREPQTVPKSFPNPSREPTGAYSIAGCGVSTACSCGGAHRSIPRNLSRASLRRRMASQDPPLSG